MTYMKRITVAVTLGAAVLIGSGLSAPPAQAAYIVTLEQVGSNVLASGSGTLDLTGLTIFGDGGTTTEIQPKDGTIVIGPASGGPVRLYTGFAGPGSFGSGAFYLPPSSGSGGIVGIDVDGAIAIPNNYISENPLSSTSTWNSQTIAGLGVTPGTYVWTWGSGAADDTFTLDVEAAVVPEPSSLLLLGVALAALLLMPYSIGTGQFHTGSLPARALDCERKCLHRLRLFKGLGEWRQRQPQS